MNKYNTIQAWLAWMRQARVGEIDLSLERVIEVGQDLDLLWPSCPVITVGGTNGKGSTVAGLEAIYQTAGYRVGVFTTPFLYQYSEQIRLQGMPVADSLICEAFETITKACRKGVQLTVFEYGTLAAWLIFKQSHLDIWILEVGLGGRWDAVNAVDADVAIVTSIELDHTEWLGNTREAIAIEKAGIFRTDRPAICGDEDPPSTLIAAANKIKAPFFCQGRDFKFIEKENSWDWCTDDKKINDLPMSSLLIQNMSTVLMAVDLLQNRLPVADEDIRNALATVQLQGRIQIVPGAVTHIFDVSHNPASVAMLANYLKKYPITGKTYAVFSMLKEKDIVSTIAGIQSYIDDWNIASLNTERAAAKEYLLECFAKNAIQVNAFDSIKLAYLSTKSKAKAGDRIIIFGSFKTVAEVAVN